MTAQSRHRAIGEGIGVRLIVGAGLVMAATMFLIPILWMLSTALKPAKEVLIVPPKWIPSEIRWRNFIDVWGLGRLDTGIKNSAIMTFSSMIGVFCSAPLVAFGFSRLQFAGRDKLFIVVLATMMLPGQVTLIPLYIIYKNLRWLDSFAPFIVPSFFGGGAFFIFLLRQFFLTIPVELEDAARIDGCSTFRIFAQIFMPLAKPALATVGIFTFINGWNAYLGPLLFLSSPQKMPITVILANFKDVQGGVQYNMVMAAACAAVLPCILVFLIFQEYMVGGIALTGIKG